MSTQEYNWGCQGWYKGRSQMHMFQLLLWTVFQSFQQNIKVTEQSIKHFIWNQLYQYTFRYRHGLDHISSVGILPSYGTWWFNQTSVVNCACTCHQDWAPKGYRCHSILSKWLNALQWWGQIRNLLFRILMSSTSGKNLAIFVPF